LAPIKTASHKFNVHVQNKIMKISSAQKEIPANHNIQVN
jgi:hypothetical protein